MFRNKTVTGGAGQCLSTRVPRPPASELPASLLEAQVAVLHRQVSCTSGIRISISSQGILRRLKPEDHWSALTVVLQVQLALLENSGITGKIKLLLQHGRQCGANSHETVMPFPDQNVFPFSAEKDSRIFKALIFVTEAVPYCFHGLPQSAEPARKRKAEVWML